MKRRLTTEDTEDTEKNKQRDLRGFLCVLCGKKSEQKGILAILAQSHSPDSQHVFGYAVAEVRG